MVDNLQTPQNIVAIHTSVYEIGISRRSKIWKLGRSETENGIYSTAWGSLAWWELSNTLMLSSLLERISEKVCKKCTEG